MSDPRLLTGLNSPVDEWAAVANKPPPLGVSPDLLVPPAKPAQTSAAPAYPPNSIAKTPDAVVGNGGKAAEVPPAYLADLDSIIVKKEGGGPASVSPAGAIGIGQVMPETAAPYLGVSPDKAREMLFDPTVNENVRKNIIKDLAQKYPNDQKAVLVAYNAGPGVADRWLAAGRDPHVLPAETQKYIGQYDTGKGWADEDRAKYGGEHNSATELMRDLMRKINEEPAGSKERRALLYQAQEASQRASDSFEQLRKTPPVYKPLDMMENFGSAAVMIGILGGLFAKRPLTASLMAGGQAMQAQQSQNWTLFKTASDQWYQQAQLGLEQSRMAHDQIREVMEDERMAENDRHARISELVSTWQMSQGFANADRNFQIQQLSALDLHNQRGQEALDRQREVHLDTQLNAAYKSGDPDQIKAAENAARAHALATKGPVLSSASTAAQTRQDLFNELQLARASGDKDQIAAAEQKIDDFNKVGGKTTTGRNAPAQFMNKYMEEHPNATSEELASAMGDYRRMQSVETGFGGGLLGRQVISLNTVAGHILRVEEYWDALKNNNIPRLNAIANRVALETGKPEVAAFDIGRDIMSDEIVRLLTSTGGTEADRAGMQNRLSRDFSPAQIRAAIDTLKDFTGQRFDGLKQQYAQGDKSREERFVDKLLTDKAREVYQKQPPQMGGGPTALPADLPPPTGHAEGSVAKDDSGKIVARIRNGQWAPP